MVVNKIEKITKEKSLYVLHINKNTYPIDSYFYECLLPYDGKVLDVYQMLDTIAFSNAASVLKTCYKKLFNHEMSTYELKSKLANKGISTTYIERIILFFKNEGQLKEKDLIARYIDIYQETKGLNAFKRFLEGKKISKASIEFAINNFTESKEFAYNLAKKYIKNKISSKAMLKLKVEANLRTKGYTSETINYVMDNLELASEDASLEKEIVNLKKRYPTDYYKVYGKLAAKGYNIDNIRKYLKKEGFKDEN